MRDFLAHPDPSQRAWWAWALATHAPRAAHGLLYGRPDGSLVEGRESEETGEGEGEGEGEGGAVEGGNDPAGYILRLAQSLPPSGLGT